MTRDHAFFRIAGRRSPSRGLGTLLVAIVLTGWGLAAGAGAARADPVGAADQARQRGELGAAVRHLEAEHARASGVEARSRSAVALAAAVASQRRLDTAIALLEEVMASEASAGLRARAANDLGNLYLGAGRAADAGRLYELAAALAPGDRGLRLASELNLLRLPAAAERGRRLRAVLAALGELAEPLERARYAINLADLARAAGEVGLAHEALERSRAIAAGLGAHRLEAEALDALAALYEAGGRHDEAMSLTLAGLDRARAATAHDLLIPLESRMARLWQARGRSAAAIAALRNAVAAIEAVRPDLPVTYANGRSSFRETLAPVYGRLADLLLQQARRQAGAEQAASLRQARDAVERIKQSEMEDYLGSRCGVGLARATPWAAGGTAAIPAGVGVLYPIVLDDRVELLLETARGLVQAVVPVAASRVEVVVRDFLARTTNDDLDPRVAGRQLHDWLIAPLAANLAETEVTTLVVVPDGLLRLVPFAALHDGRDFLLRRFAIAIAPGLDLFVRERGRPGGAGILLAGMSEPGRVVDRLPESVLQSILQPGVGAPRPGPARSLRSVVPAGPGEAARRDALSRSLSLPGVREEVQGLNRITGGEVLLDQEFTLENFRNRVASGRNRVVHLATHGLFGPTAETTFLMTHDDLLTLERLQEIVRASEAVGGRIDLLTLSACQTAEGDDRAPLGLAGAAIRARTGSALGSLWPVRDDAAVRLMAGFYEALGPSGKAASLRASQLRLMAEEGFAHPYFWAPFVLIGDWQ